MRGDDYPGELQGQDAGRFHVASIGEDQHSGLEALVFPDRELTFLLVKLWVGAHLL